MIIYKQNKAINRNYAFYYWGDISEKKKTMLLIIGNVGFISLIFKLIVMFLWKLRNKYLF